MRTVWGGICRLSWVNKKHHEKPPWAGRIKPALQLMETPPGQRKGEGEGGSWARQRGPPHLGLPGAEGEG